MANPDSALVNHGPSSSSPVGEQLRGLASRSCPLHSSCCCRCSSGMQNCAGDEFMWEEHLPSARALLLPGDSLVAHRALSPSSIYMEMCTYQVRTSWEALLANTLLCLPTGLGKTLVAAVVMYNFYWWFPGNKFQFLAPTKPLVAQQQEACTCLLGIPAEHMAEMMGGCLVMSSPWLRMTLFSQELT
ncbi:hypothetical protein L345_05418, partial [Ophiophagus hannah]